jgi:hypothetical protein
MKAAPLESKNKHMSAPKVVPDKSTIYRRRLLALFLPISAVVYIASEAVSPKGTDQVIQNSSDALRLLAIAAQHPSQLYFAGACAVVGLAALAVSYLAIATLINHKGAVLATIAALIGGIGAFCGVITNVLVFPNLASAATAHVTRAAASQFLVTSFSSTFGHCFTYAYLLAELIAPFLMGLALWRSQRVPRWLAVLFFVGLQVAEFQSSGGPKVILFMLPFAAAMFLLSAYIWNMNSNRSRGFIFE